MCPGQMDWVLVWPWVDGLDTHEALGRNLVPRRKLAVAIKNKVTFCRSEQSYLEKGKKKSYISVLLHTPMQTKPFS